MWEKQMYRFYELVTSELVDSRGASVKALPTGLHSLILRNEHLFDNFFENAHRFGHRLPHRVKSPWSAIAVNLYTYHHIHDNKRIWPRPVQVPKLSVNRRNKMQKGEVATKSKNRLGNLSNHKVLPGYKLLLEPNPKQWNPTKHPHDYFSKRKEAS